MIKKFGSELMHKKVIGMIDSESSLGALIKGYSRTEDISESVSLVWDEIASRSINLFLDRVSTDANISDEPSRDCWDIHNQCGWQAVTIEIPHEIMYPSKK